MSSDWPSSSTAFAFADVLGRLKTEKRTGWVNHKVSRPESIADHMYRMAGLSFLFVGQEGVDSTRLLKMAVVHDLAESLVGDITPHDGVTKEEKHRMEMEAIEKIANILPNKAGTEEILELFNEYEGADEYERAQPGLDLSSFFETTTDDKFYSEEIKGWVQDLRLKRSQRLAHHAM